MPRLKKGFSCRVNQEITVFKSHFIVLMIHINNNRRFGTTYTGDKKKYSSESLQICFSISHKIGPKVLLLKLYCSFNNIL